MVIVWEKPACPNCNTVKGILQEEGIRFETRQIFDGDISQLKQNIGDSSKVTAALASFLLKQERFDEAFDAWNSLPVEERKTVFRQRGEDHAR